MIPRGGSSQAILDVAERLAQTRGFNGFSYADIAAALGVTKASLHYHFASKEDLGCAMIERYDRNFSAALAAIDTATADILERLRRYTDIYVAVVSNNRMCLCGMLAAEITTLPARMQAPLSSFFDANERWLARALEDGRRAELMDFPQTAVERARLLIGALEGAMLVARTYREPQRLQSVAAQLLGDLQRARPATRRRRRAGVVAQIHGPTKPKAPSGREH